jgi:hypothetical protein
MLLSFSLRLAIPVRPEIPRRRIAVRANMRRQGIAAARRVYFRREKQINCSPPRAVEAVSIRDIECKLLGLVEIRTTQPLLAVRQALHKN